MVVSVSLLSLVTEWLTVATTLTSITRISHRIIHSQPGKDQNLQFELRFLLNAYSFRLILIVSGFSPALVTAPLFTLRGPSFLSL